MADEPGTAPPSRDDDLDRLDEVLFVSRRWVKRPGHRRRFHELLGMDVQLATIRVLRAVERAAEGEPTVGVVASVMGVDPSTASRLVTREVTQGRLDRRQCDEDARRSKLVLTEAGRDTLTAVTRARRQILAEVTTGWKASEIDLLAELLTRLGERFDELEDQE